MTARALSLLIADQDLRPGLPGWQVWAEPVEGTGVQWCAAFSRSSPQHLVRAFVEVLADPAPVARRAPPHGVVEHLTTPSRLQT